MTSMLQTKIILLCNFSKVGETEFGGMFAFRYYLVALVEVFSLLAVIIDFFSAVHRPHPFEMLLYVLALSLILHSKA